MSRKERKPRLVVSRSTGVFHYETCSRAQVFRSTQVVPLGGLSPLYTETLRPCGHCKPVR